MKTIKAFLLLGLTAGLLACGNGNSDDTTNTTDSTMMPSGTDTGMAMPVTDTGTGGTPAGSTPVPADNTGDNSGGGQAGPGERVPTGTERTKDRMTDDSVNNRVNMGSSR